MSHQISVEKVRKNEGLSSIAYIELHKFTTMDSGAA